jgi:hypothetical protein
MSMTYKTLALGAALLAMGSISTVAVAQDAKAIEEAVLKQIKIEPEKLDAPALKKTFSAAFYKVNIKISQGDGYSTSKMSLAFHEGKFVNVESTTTTRPMPVLQSLVNKGFKLKTEADAKAFEEALDVLFPVRSFGDDKKVKGVKKAAPGWHFIRGKFFKDLKGFVVETDGAGAITSIKYDLKIKA